MITFGVDYKPGINIINTQVVKLMSILLSRVA